MAQDRLLIDLLLVDLRIDLLCPFLSLETLHLVLFDRSFRWMTAPDLIHSDRSVEQPQTGYFDRTRLLIQILFPMDENNFSLNASDKSLVCHWLVTLVHSKSLLCHVKPCH